MQPLRTGLPYRRTHLRLYSDRTHRLKLPSTILETLRAHELSSSDDAASNQPRPVEVHGWVESIRKQKTIGFAHLSDGSTVKPLQAVLKTEDVQTLKAGMSVRLHGQLVRSQGHLQGVELLVDRVVELGDCDPVTYPLKQKTLKPETLRNLAHLRARTPRMTEVLRIRHELSRQFHNWFHNEGFSSVTTPILTSSDCEGAGEVFRIQSPSSQSQSSHPDPPSPRSETNAEFFSRPAYLTVSAQLHLECLLSLSRVYTLSPAFRAEPSLTSRHLSEFYMLEAEIAFVDSLGGVMDVVEGCIHDCVENLLKERRGELSLLRTEEEINALESSICQPWPRIRYNDALAILRSALPGTFVYCDLHWGVSLQSEHEKYLASHFGKPVFVTNYPRQLKPFYMRLDDNESRDSEGETVACFDLLVPGLGELVGGSMREERLSHLEKAIDLVGLPREDYEWYLDLRRFGSVSHGGFGMGWDRLVSWVTGLDSIRDCVPFPRWAGNMVL